MGTIDDLISREHILLQLSHNKNKGDEEWELAVLNDMKTVREAPSVTPKQAIDYARKAPTIKPRKGKWKEIGGVIKWGCPFCHHAYEVKSNFCSNCGADMRKETE